MTNILSTLKLSFRFPITRKVLRSISILSVLTFFSIQATAQNTVINGVGEYTEFGKPTLLIKLELGVPTEDVKEVLAMDSSKQLSFRLLEDRTARRWSQLWIQSLSINNGPSALTKQTDDLIMMSQAIPAGLKQGDLIEFERVANNLTLMIMDGVEIAEFETEGFFEFLLSAFIGPVPPSGELKAALLKAGDINTDTNVLFDSLSYSLDRADVIASWIAPEEEVIEEPAEQVVAEAAEVVEVEVATTETAAEAIAPVETTVAVADIVEEVTGNAPDLELADSGGGRPDDSSTPTSRQNAGSKAGSKAGSQGTNQASTPVEEEDAPIIFTAESLLAVQNYQREMLVKIYQNIEYPRAAQRRNREGSLRIAVAVNKDGSLDNVSLLQEAEYEDFNDAALVAVDEASPFTSLPDTVLDLPMVVEIPIQFRLQ